MSLRDSEDGCRIYFPKTISLSSHNPRNGQTKVCPTLTPAVLMMIRKSPDLRISGRAQERRVNVRHGFRIGPTRLVSHARPIGIRPERVPCLFARGHVVESDQVGQMRQSLARDRLAEEDRREPAVAEDLDLLLVEHLKLVAQAEAAARFICAKHEDARRAAQARNHVEATDRPDALPLQHRHKMVLEELLYAGGLDVVA